jgi:hypothetical protein
MPALLRIKRYIDNDIWKINFSLDLSNLPESDKDLMRKFGEPEIDTGGTFTVPSMGGDTEYTLPNKFIKIKSGLPYTQEFDSKSPVFENDTQNKALAYEQEFISRYSEAFQNLRNNLDTFTGESVENI